MRMELIVRNPRSIESTRGLNACVECHLASFAEQCALSNASKILPRFVPEFRQLIAQSDSSLFTIASLSPRIAEVLKNKRLCLFDVLIREAGHEDLTSVDDLKKVFEFSLRSVGQPACLVMT